MTKMNGLFLKKSKSNKIVLFQVTLVFYLINNKCVMNVKRRLILRINYHSHFRNYRNKFFIMSKVF